MTDDRLIAGVDAGTTRIRAIVFTPEGRVVAEGSRPTPVERPRPGWAEHDAEALWQATCGALRDATTQIEHPARIRGLALASVGEAFVALDADGRPTCPVIAWYDERPAPQLARLEAEIGKDRLYALTGRSPDPTFSLCKLLWLHDNQPEALARTRLWLNVGHYLAWRLCGVPGADLSLASRSLALDLHRRRWAGDLIREVGLSPVIFPEIRPCGARLGGVTTEGAAATGLTTECVVGVAGHDHIMGALAAGALAPGVLLDSMGSAEGLTLALPASTAEPELARRGYSQGVVEVEQPVAYVFGGFPTSGACIEWFRVLFSGEVAHAQLIAEAERAPPCCHGATFVPDLRGRISPTPDPLARGAWFGIGADATRGALYRALLEGLAFEARQTVDSLIELPSLPRIEAVRAIGGNTRNPLLMAIKAAVCDRPIAAAEMAEATALGAALLGGRAAGVFTDLSSAVAGLAATCRTYQPRASWVARYEAHYRGVYQPAYAQLRPLHHAAAALETRDGLKARPPG
ncbi:MAG: FGGY-family carbohydrate kinase [Geminicoccaceae bacterium]